jgi:hypothetical protein
MQDPIVNGLNDPTIDMLEITLSQGEPVFIPAEDYSDDYTQIALWQLLYEDLRRRNLAHGAKITGVIYRPAQIKTETGKEIIMPNIGNISIAKSIKSIAGIIRSSTIIIANDIATPIVAIAAIGIGAVIILPIIAGII